MGSDNDGDGDYEKNVEGQQQALFDLETLPDQTRQKALDLLGWLQAFQTKTENETVRKAVKYGSADLKVMGEAMVLILPREHRSEQMGLQMAVAFYLLGKVARIFGAFEQGHSPTADDWFDAEVYSKMGLKIFETGKWL